MDINNFPDSGKETVHMIVTYTDWKCRILRFDETWEDIHFQKYVQITENIKSISTVGENPKIFK